jgi:hypothetical protein
MDIVMSSAADFLAISGSAVSIRQSLPPADEASLTNQEKALVELGGVLREMNYHFTTLTPASQARVNARAENTVARDPQGVFGWSRPFKPGLLPGSIVQLMRRAGILAEGDSGEWRSSVRFSTLGDQLFVHSAYPTTEADAVFFGPDTIRFVAAIEDHLRDAGQIHWAADVGCGAGPGGIAIASGRPGASVSMIDINDAALRTARVNAALNATSNAVPMRGDVLQDISGQFDLIVSNPPYLIDPGARAYRHGGGDLGEGLSLRIIREAIPRLNRGGSLLVYTGSAIVGGRDGFRERAEQTCGKLGLAFDYRELDPDVFGEELETPAYRNADRIAVVLFKLTLDG